MRLQLYVLAEIVANFLFTAAVLSFISFLVTAIIATYRLPGASPSLVVGYVPILIMYIFPYLLPMSLLVGVVLTYGRMASDNEITAIRAGGVHLWQIFSPSLLVGFGLAAATLPLVNDVIPRFHFQKTEYLREAARQLIRNVNPALRSIHTSNFHLEWSVQKGQYFEDVLLDLQRGEDEGAPMRIQAERALIQFQGDDLVLTLSGVTSLVHKKEGGTTGANTETVTMRLSFEEISGARRLIQTKESECTSAEIAVKLERGIAPEPDRARYEIHRRCATVFSGALFAAIGVPIGIFLRRGTRLAAFATAFSTILGGYYPILYFMETLAKEQAISPIVAAWMGNAILAVVACVLLRKLFRI